MVSKRDNGDGAPSGASEDAFTERLSKVGFASAPARMVELWRWVSAVAAYDFGDGRPLARLIREEETPPEFRDAIAQIVEGKRKPTRGAARAKVPAAERMRLAASLSVVLDLIDTIRLHGVGDSSVQAVAARQRKEPKQVVADLYKRRRRVIQDVCDQFGIRPETVEELLREMRNRVRRWPVV